MGSAATLDVPCTETVSLHERFKTEWSAAWDSLDGSSGRTDFNAPRYDAHIRAVKLQAKVVGTSRSATCSIS